MLAATLPGRAGTGQGPRPGHQLWVLRGRRGRERGELARSRARAADPGGRTLSRVAGLRTLGARSASSRVLEASEKELKIAVPLVLVVCIVLASLVVPGLTGALICLEPPPRIR